MPAGQHEQQQSEQDRRQHFPRRRPQQRQRRTDRDRYRRDQQRASVQALFHLSAAAHTAGNDKAHDPSQTPRLGPSQRGDAEPPNQQRIQHRRRAQPRHAKPEPIQPDQQPGQPQRKRQRDPAEPMKMADQQQSRDDPQARRRWPLCRDAALQQWQTELRQPDHPQQGHGLLQRLADQGS